MFSEESSSGNGIGDTGVDFFIPMLLNVSNSYIRALFLIRNS